MLFVFIGVLSRCDRNDAVWHPDCVQFQAKRLNRAVRSRSGRSPRPMVPRRHRACLPVGAFMLKTAAWQGDPPFLVVHHRRRNPLREFSDDRSGARRARFGALERESPHHRRKRRRQGSAGAATFTPTRIGRRDRSWRSTAPASRRRCSSPSCSATCAAASPARIATRWDSCSSRIADAVPRRSRRDEPAHAGDAAAVPRERRDPAGRRRPAAQHRGRPRDCRARTATSMQRGPGRRAARRPALPPAGRPSGRAAAQRSPRGHPAARSRTSIAQSRTQGRPSQPRRCGCSSRIAGRATCASYAT